MHMVSFPSVVPGPFRIERNMRYVPPNGCYIKVGAERPGCPPEMSCRRSPDVSALFVFAARPHRLIEVFFLQPQGSAEQVLARAAVVAADCVTRVGSLRQKHHQESQFFCVVQGIARRGDSDTHASGTQPGQSPRASHPTLRDSIRLWIWKGFDFPALWTAVVKLYGCGGGLEYVPIEATRSDARLTPYVTRRNPNLERQH